MLVDHDTGDREDEVRKGNVFIGKADPFGLLRPIEEQLLPIANDAAYFRPRRQEPWSLEALAIERDDAERLAVAVEDGFQAAQKLGGVKRISTYSMSGILSGELPTSNLTETP